MGFFLVGFISFNYALHTDTRGPFFMLNDNFFHIIWLKAPLYDQSFLSKTWSKFFDRVNLKLCERTLMDFGGIETHPIFLKSLTCVDPIYIISVDTCKLLLT